MEGRCHPGTAGTVYGTGARPLGEETAAFIQIVRWMETQAHTQTIRVDSSGMRGKVVSLIASALHPEMFSELVIHSGIERLANLLLKPVKYGDAGITLPGFAARDGPRPTCRA